MPKTHFDCIQHIRPELLEEVKKDVKYLVNGGRNTPILNVDEYHSSFKNYSDKVIEKFLQDLEKKTRIYSGLIIQNLNQLPDIFKQQLIVLMNNINHEFHYCVNFLLAGKKTFFFSDMISQNLVYTEINLPATEIQLPFCTCQLVFTEKEVIDAFYLVAMKDNPNLEIDYSCPISVFVTLYDNCDILNGRRLIIYSHHSKYPDEIFMVQKRELFLGNNWSLEQSLKTDWERLTTDNVEVGLSYNNGILSGSEDEQFYTDGLLFYRIVMNAILYIISKNSEFPVQNSSLKDIKKNIKNAKSFTKKIQLEKDLNRISSLDYFEVGVSEKPIILKRENNCEEQVDYSIIDRKIIRRFMVRGHWRNQRYGTGLTETKLIWIKPYIKGDDLSEMINKPYFVT